MSRGPFITFEGGEGSTKTTQIERAAAHVSTTFKVPVFCTRDPGGTPICDGIRAVLLDARHAAIDPMVELLLYLASRRQLTQEVILPRLKAGECVLCDRYSDSTWAYQVYSRLGEYFGPVPGFPTVRNFEHIEEAAQTGIEPDLTIWLDVPVEVGLQRARARAEVLVEEKREDRFERKGLEFHQRIRDGYGRRYVESGNRIVRVDARGTVEEVWELVKSALNEFFDRRWGKRDG